MDGCKIMEVLRREKYHPALLRDGYKKQSDNMNSAHGYPRLTVVR